MAKIDERFIVELQGKQFVTYEGLLDLAHQKGIKGMKTELIQIPSKDNSNTCIVHAKAMTEDGEFHGIGDANPSNVNSFIAKHLIRMAETRAKARALRDLTNVGMTAIEELGDEDENKQYNKSNSNKKHDTHQTNSHNNNLVTDKQRGFLYKLAKQKNFEKKMLEYIKKTFNKNSSAELTKQEASEVIQKLQEMK